MDTDSGPDGDNEANAGVVRAVSAGHGARGPPTPSIMFADRNDGGTKRPGFTPVSPYSAVVTAVINGFLSRGRSGDVMNLVGLIEKEGVEADDGDTLVEFLTPASMAATATMFKHRAGIGPRRSRHTLCGDATTGPTAPSGNGDEEAPRH